jgi:ThiF family
MVMQSSRPQPQRQHRLSSTQQPLLLSVVKIAVACQVLLRCCGNNIHNNVFAFSLVATKQPRYASISWFGIQQPYQQQQLLLLLRHKTDGNALIGSLRSLSSLPFAQNNNEDANDVEPQSESTDALAASLSNEEIGRYSRHLVLSNVGMTGQVTLKQSAVLVIGAGGLGSPVLLYLAAAGVGHIGIVDGDTVDVSNLQRQIIHNIHTVDMSKCQSAQQAIVQLNPNVHVRIYEEEFTVNTAPRIITHGFAPNIPWNIVIDGSDNFPTKYLIKYVGFGSL